MPSSVCHMALDLHHGIEVHVGETKVCNFDNPPRTIGARNIRGSTIVIIYSGLGAIMANIAPARDSELSRDVEDGTQHAREHMQQVLDCYHEHKDRLFGTGVEASCVVYAAVYRSPRDITPDGLSVCLPHQMAGIGVELATIGFEPLFKFYLFTEQRRSSLSRGTAMVDGRGFVVAVYLDDRTTHVIETPRAAADRLRR
ncbi:hypothetical protein PISL3812_08322 [Talaromyces islandicus]|uniref:Uncharacterized protein n=1 Tax=Talaromyces islandicus TaxID=28573 RepID=A0A0U1M6P8_TALIS|nr:hypothetical protein PISL3812_08322 [Talaromyces islandicus]